MSDKKLLLITFDYELFLGEKSGTVQQCLIDPTDKLLDLLGKYAFKALFFIDTVYILSPERNGREAQVGQSRSGCNNQAINSIGE